MKHMKRSMFITTLIMTVVLVVALSTATFAWYTANTQVTSNTVAVYTARSTSASLAVSSSTFSTVDLDNTYIEMSVNANSAANGIQPMIPKTALTTGETTYADASAATFFNTANIDAAGNFKAAGANTAPAKITYTQALGGELDEDTPTEQGFFYVVNTSDGAIGSVTVDVLFGANYYSVKTGVTSDNFADLKAGLYTKTGTTYTAVGSAAYDNSATYYEQVAADATLKGAMRVAVFVNDTYLKTFTNSASSYSYGTITSGSEASSFGTASTTDVVNSGTPTSIGSIASHSQSKIAVVVWYEGLSVVNNKAGLAAGFSLVFAAA